MPKYHHPIIPMVKENFTGTSGIIADVLSVIVISLLFSASLYAFLAIGRGITAVMILKYIFLKNSFFVE